MRRAVVTVIALLAVATMAGEPAPPKPKPDPLKDVLENTQPLKTPRGERLPLILFTPDYPNVKDDADLEKVLKDLDARGITLLSRWGGDPNKGGADFPLRVGKLQKKLGLKVCIDAQFIHNFYAPHTPDLAHKDAEGKPFFDTSVMWQPGCPFTLKDRIAAVKKTNEDFLARYKEAGIDIDFWTADFEFDGPLEWNDGWAAAKKCTVCQAKIANIASFPEFQKAVREIRTQMQAECFSQPVKAQCPKVLIGVYGMNPNDGYRYWWDFFEKDAKVEGVKYVDDHGAVYRPWANEFDKSGYTVAIPVLYGYRFPIPNVKFNPYDFKNREMGWVYSILKEASSTRKNTNAATPVIPFVAWATPQTPMPDGGLSEANYEEALWHILLRGSTGMMMYCGADQTAASIKPVHRVFEASLEYKEFLDKGSVAILDVPDTGTIISALKLNDKLLVRRTDFDGRTEPVVVKIDGKDVSVPALPGKCQILPLQ